MEEIPATSNDYMGHFGDSNKFIVDPECSKPIEIINDAHNCQGKNAT